MKPLTEAEQTERSGLVNRWESFGLDREDRDRMIALNIRANFTRRKTDVLPEEKTPCPTSK